ncbi:exopolysaccharide production repressor protein [Aureimonas frigidaquae]|uniref:exopolysaccharide production repressor protein n=1 Tax=Aureimonas frigidaquae TaxID=424757 RepID=UPI0007813485|nr:exopolysaccharide production repressor protein [Aureimonas frigidaquae]
MSFVLFFRGMLLTLTAFAIAIYWLTGSVWTMLVQTLVCAVIIQVGYFLAVLFMVWRNGNAGATAGEAKSADVAPDVYHNHF